MTTRTGCINILLVNGPFVTASDGIAACEQTLNTWTDSDLASGICNVSCYRKVCACFSVKHVKCYFL